MTPSDIDLIERAAAMLDGYALDIADAQSRLSAAEVGLLVSIQPKVACVAPQKQGSVVLDQSIPAGQAAQGSAIVLYVECKTN